MNRTIRSGSDKFVAAERITCLSFVSLVLIPVENGGKANDVDDSQDAGENGAAKEYRVRRQRKHCENGGQTQPLPEGRKEVGLPDGLARCP